MTCVTQAVDQGGPLQLCKGTSMLTAIKHPALVLLIPSSDRHVKPHTKGPSGEMMRDQVMPPSAVTQATKAAKKYFCPNILTHTHFKFFIFWKTCDKLLLQSLLHLLSQPLIVNKGPELFTSTLSQVQGVLETHPIDLLPRHFNFTTVPPSRSFLYKDIIQPSDQICRTIWNVLVFTPGITHTVDFEFPRRKWESTQSRSFSWAPKSAFLAGCYLASWQILAVLVHCLNYLTAEFYENRL